MLTRRESLKAYAAALTIGPSALASRRPQRTRGTVDAYFDKQQAFLHILHPTDRPEPHWRFCGVMHGWKDEHGGVVVDGQVGMTVVSSGDFEEDLIIEDVKVIPNH